jgi:hypothetical protein
MPPVKGKIKRYACPSSFEVFISRQVESKPFTKKKFRIQELQEFRMNWGLPK